MSKRLGKIKQLDLREIFQDEARDFTPWLAKEENLRALSDEIGIELKLLEIEADVGCYNVDILAEEEATGRKVVIENQLETTDHDHLGKVLTYASGHDASVAIWIFKEIKEEHRQAIDWINEHIDDSIDFFAIKMQLWQIDDSIPAPKFDIVVSPNKWAKTIKSKSLGEMTNTKVQQLDFWTKYKAYVSENDKNMRLQTPRPQHWYDVSIGTSEAHISLTVNTNKNLLGCEIYINNNKDLFNYLKERKQVIESDLNLSLEWIEASKATRIKTSIGEFDIENQDRFNEYFGWLYEKTVDFQRVFPTNIRAFKNNR